MIKPFYSQIRHYFTAYRSEHPWSFSFVLVGFLWAVVLHICLISKWDVVNVFSIGATCLVGLMFLVVIWTLLEEKRLASKEKVAGTDVLEKIRCIISLICLIIIIAMIVVTWASQGDVIVKKCVATTVSIISLLVGGNITLQFVGRGSIFNGPVTLQHSPVENNEMDIQDFKQTEQVIGEDVKIDQSSFDPNVAAVYSVNTKIEKYDENI